MIYLVTFSAATALIWASGRSRDVIFGILATMGLAIPRLTVSVCDEIVGAEVLSYAKWLCIDEQVIGILEFLQIESGIVTLGRNLSSWVVIRLIDSLPSYLLCIEVLCIIPVYLGLRRASLDNVWIGMFPWLLLELALILNGMRQSVAMGFMFYATNYIFDCKLERFVLWLAVGMLFHQTAVIGLLLYLFAHTGVIGSGFMCFFGRRSIRVLAEVIAACVRAILALGLCIVVLVYVIKDSYRYRVSYLGKNDCRVYGAYLLASVLLIWVLTRYEFTDGEAVARGVALGERFSVVYLLSAVGSLAWQLHLISGSLARVGYYGAALFTHLRVTHSQCIPRAGSFLAASTFPSYLLCGDGVHAGQGRRLAVYAQDAWDCLAWQRELSTCLWVDFIDINHSPVSTGGCLWRF